MRLILPRLLPDRPPLVRFRDDKVLRSLATRSSAARERD